MEGLMTVEQAAHELGLKPGSVRDAIARKRLRSIKVGARLNLIERAEVERYRVEHLGKRGRPATGKE